MRSEQSRNSDELFANFIGLWLGFLWCAAGMFVGAGIARLSCPLWRPLGTAAGMFVAIATALLGYRLGYLFFYRLIMSGTGR